MSSFGRGPSFFQPRPSACSRDRSEVKRHVRDSDFEEGFNPDEFFRKVIDNIRPMNSVQSHYLMNSLYAVEFKLFDFLDSEKAIQNPFAVIRAFPEEDPSANSLLEDVMTRYRRNRIESRLKITFLEYLKLPLPVARQFDDLAHRIIGPIEKEEKDAQTKAFQEMANKQ